MMTRTGEELSTRQLSTRQLSTRQLSSAPTTSSAPNPLSCCMVATFAAVPNSETPSETLLVVDCSGGGRSSTSAP